MKKIIVLEGKFWSLSFWCKIKMKNVVIGKFFNFEGNELLDKKKI